MVEHSNSWLSLPAQLIGSGIGAFYGGPIGSSLGGQAGSGIGTTLGDLFGGNWSGVGEDFWSELQKGLSAGQLGMNPLSILGGGTQQSQVPAQPQGLLSQPMLRFHKPTQGFSLAGLLSPDSYGGG